MEQIQEIKNKLDMMGIQYVPANQFSINDLVNRLTVELPNELKLFLSEIGYFKLDNGDFVYGLDTPAVSENMELQYILSKQDNLLHFAKVDDIVFKYSLLEQCIVKSSHSSGIKYSSIYEFLSSFL